MNYYSDEEISRVIEEPDRQPRPAATHVALTNQGSAKPKKDRTALKFGLFAAAVFAFVLVANAVDLPPTILALFAGLLIGIFVGMTANGNS